MPSWGLPSLNFRVGDEHIHEWSHFPSRLHCPHQISSIVPFISGRSGCGSVGAAEKDRLKVHFLSCFPFYRRYWNGSTPYDAAPHFHYWSVRAVVIAQAASSKFDSCEDRFHGSS